MCTVAFRLRQTTPVKIALLHYTAPPITGGVERVVGEQIRVLRENGHHVSLACFEGGDTTSVDAFIPLSRDSGREDFAAYLGLALGGVDCVLIHNIGTMPFAPELTHSLRTLAGLHTNTRWICWVHDLALGNPDYPATIPCAEQPYSTGCADWEYIAVSPLRAREVREQLGVPCKVIPNGIDTTATLQLSAPTAALAESLNLWDADFVLLNPSRILPRKTLEIGVEVVHAVRSLGCTLKYLITGATDPHNPIHAAHAHDLRLLVRNLHLEDTVHFVNEHLPVGPRELGNLYQICDAVWLTSAREGFGLPALEAGAFGKTVFCPDAEPMNGLPGVVTYPRDISISNLAAWLLQQLKGREAILARRRILHTYRWQSIYHSHLAPLLEQPPTAP
jgi:glycosyltransferase involved in cell wall biosynthesis